jgi:L-fuconolactonase
MINQSTFRFLLLIAVGITASLSSNAKPSAGLPKVKHIIDTHIHLYDTNRKEGVPWPPKDDKVLHKPHLPAEFNRVAKAAGVTGVVIVEASDRIPDNQWILDLVKNDCFYVGLVGNIDPYRDDFAKILNKLKQDPRFVGIRLRVDGKEIDYADPKVRANLRILAQAGLSADILMNAKGIETLEQVTDLAAAIPDLRLVVDHVLGYNVDGELPSCEWQNAVKKLASNKNVYCKISGLYQRCTIQPASQDPNFYKPLLDILWNQFGSDRLIYGSNWPCTKKSGDYKSFVTLVNAYFSNKGQEASEKYFWANAAKVYKLKL